MWAQEDLGVPSCSTSQRLELVRIPSFRYLTKHVMTVSSFAGDITILDHDSVELSNLHRQVLHTEERVGMPKAESARIALQACVDTLQVLTISVLTSGSCRLNSDITIHSHVLPFTPALFHPPLSTNSTPQSILEGTFDLVLDCTDNPATRHFLNAYAVSKGIPLVSGGAVRAEGTVGVYGLPLPATEENRETARGPCYACLFPPSPPPPAPPSLSSDPAAFDKYYEQLSLAGTGACADEGVVGMLCGVVGLGMVGEAMKVLLGTGECGGSSPFSSSNVQGMRWADAKRSMASQPNQPSTSSHPSPRRPIAQLRPARASQPVQPAGPSPRPPLPPQRRAHPNRAGNPSSILRRANGQAGRTRCANYRALGRSLR